MNTRRTPLYALHQAAGARFVNFGGWEMPLSYTRQMEEHHQVRNAAGIFDVSHMGEVEIEGPGALDAVNALISNDLRPLSDGQACYTVMCTPEGGIVDDLVVYRRDEAHILICVNAGNREKDFEWIKAHISPEVRVYNRSDDYVQIALQGPDSNIILSSLTSTHFASLKPFHFLMGEVAGIPDVLISRTGYTGEHGFEFYLPNHAGPKLWSALQAYPTLPIGLGARDTLRMEMKYCLYGQDIDETTTPLDARLGWLTKLQKDSFIGREALLRQKKAGMTRCLVSFTMDGRTIPRHGYPVVDAAGAQVGYVTSGTRSPSLNKSIGLAYVPWGAHKIDMPIHVQIRQRVETGVIIRPPFVKATPLREP